MGVTMMQKLKYTILIRIAQRLNDDECIDDGNNARNNIPKLKLRFAKDEFLRI